MTALPIPFRAIVRPSTDEAISHAAQAIHVASGDLLDVTLHGLTTNAQAISLYHIATGLRERLDAVVVKALEQADALTGR